MVFMTSVPALSDGLEASMHLLVRYFVACVEQFNPPSLSGRADARPQPFRGGSHCSTGSSALDVNSLKFFHPYCYYLLFILNTRHKNASYLSYEYFYFIFSLFITVPSIILLLTVLLCGKKNL